ncbi:FAD-binding oxidoreductase [Aestuariicella hydrocarbonica]|uniref:FAD-binding oxidoreductase n=1 Tax=Pseudomaricurvus hydrocarbonicus TaxID=1470433 RepID=A0A9E5MQH2_9GAMM|nr:FAD-dependent oxidoreductase [Aestuariicella hydrocarbonica]NHO68555.1 FAD-binding oxidoreductase [Aestuariicella hydrocarbonica]
MPRYDVVIVGAGVIGCACAYYLARAGVRVAVLDRNQVNSGASGRNAGSLHFQLEYRLIQNQDLLDRQLPFLLPLTLAGIEQWRSLPEELGVDIGLKMTGGLMVAETPKQIALLRKKSEIETRCGLNVEWLSGDEARQLQPGLSQSVQAALFCPDEGHCNPRLLTPAYARQAEAAGAKFLEPCEVVDLARTGGKWLVRCRLVNGGAEETIQAESVVNASGAWASELALKANLHLPLFPVALMMSVTEAAPKVLKYLVQHVGRKLSLKQVSDGNILVGGGWSAKLQTSAKQGAGKPEIRLDNLQKNLAAACDVLPAVRDLNLIRTWTGITGITLDHLPVIGQFAEAPGFYVAAGGSGFTYGPTYAKLLSEYILTNRQPELLKPYSPDRFSDLNMFMGQ